MKNKLYFLFSLSFYITINLHAQNFPWSSFFSNEGAEFAYDIKQTSNNGYIIAAYGSDGGSSDYYVVKVDQFGALEWQKIISKDNYSERAFSVLETEEGDFIIVGNATSFNKPWLVKLNPQGDTLWTTQWTDEVQNNSGLLARGVLLQDGRIVVVSHEDQYGLDPYMFIVNSDGSLFEERDLESLIPIGWYTGTTINDIEPTNDGGFILTGSTGGGTGSRAYLWKFNANADSSWSSIFNETGIWMRSAQSVIQLSNGDYMITGFTAPNATTTAVVRANSAGELIWYQSYNDTVYTNGTDLIEWKSGECLITEKRFSGFGESFFQSALIRIDSQGNMLARDLILGSDSSTTITQMRRTNDGGYVIAGEINEYLSVGQQDLFVLKSDSLGNIDGVYVDYVWPGDVNYDGEVNMADLMILGVTAGSTGPDRVDKSILWYPHYVTDWADTVVSGVNYKHADTDGNGIVTISDTLAISQNYSFTHILPNGKSTSLSDPELFVVPDEITLINNNEVHIPLYLGTSENSVTDLYGLYFQVEIEEEYFDLSSTSFDLENSWITNFSANYWDIVMIASEEGKFEYGLTLVDHEEISGHGLLGILMLTLNESAGNNWEEINFNLNFTNVNANKFSLDLIPHLIMRIIT
ncbi:MAG: hypothetical protein R2750_11915 [Bacteroidales bacterium]